MSDTETVQATDEQTGASVDTGITSEAAQNAKESRTVEDIVAKHQATEKEAEEAAPRKPGQSVNERISTITAEKKAAIARAEAAEAKQAEMSQAMTDLRGEMDSIKGLLSQGRITQAQAEQATETAQDVFEEALKDMELSADLLPYRKDLIEMSKRIATAAMKPYEEAIEQQRAEAYKAHQATSWTGYMQEYPDLFDEKANDDGLKELKTEFNEEAMKMAQYIDIRTPEGVKHILEALQRKVDSTKTAVERVEKEKLKVDQAKKMKVEAAASSATPSKSKSVEDIVKKNMQKAGMEVR